jgi:hypothetical protein
MGMKILQNEKKATIAHQKTTAYTSYQRSLRFVPKE